MEKDAFLTNIKICSSNFDNINTIVLQTVT
jgi:hypothetical protein